MIDKYTKFVLTIIAIALSVIAAKYLAPTDAVAKGSDCGSINRPCYIDFGGSGGLPVRIEK